MEDLKDFGSGCGSKRKGRKAYTPQKRNQLLKKRTKKRMKKWNQSRIDLGRTKEKWNKLKKKYKFPSDYELAEFLMDR